MEEMKNKLGKNIGLYLVSFLCMMSVGFQCVAAMIRIQLGTSRISGTVIGFSAGLALGGGLLAIINIVRLCRIIKDEKKIRTYFNRLNDERLKEIRRRSGMPMLLYTSLLVLGAAMIASFFNEIVFYTLIAVSMVQLTIGCIVKLYFSKVL